MNESWTCPRCGQESDDSFDFHLDKQDVLTRFYTCDQCKTEWTASWRLTGKTFSENNYQMKITLDGIFTKLETTDQFYAFVKAAGYHNGKHWFEKTGVSFPEIRGKWFDVVRNRVIFEE